MEKARMRDEDNRKKRDFVARPNKSLDASGVGVKCNYEG
jgi:hypothetical protein